MDHLEERDVEKGSGQQSALKKRGTAIVNRSNAWLHPRQQQKILKDTVLPTEQLSKNTHAVFH